MRSLILMLGFLTFASSSLMAQIQVRPEEAYQHIGEEVQLCGRIFGGIYLDQKEKQPTFLNMGAAYPDHLVTILIWGKDRKQFSYKPEEQWKDQEVCVTGKLVSYKGKPEIIVSREQQIQPR